MKVLSASKVVLAFDEIVEGARRKIVIVTPYFDPWPHLAQTLLQKLDGGVSIEMLLRGGDDRAKGAAAAEPFVERGARVQFLDRLHAKLYLTEQHALLTSMNLIRASRDSWEVGTLYDATGDAASYREIADIAKRLFNTVELPTTSERAAPRAAAVPKRAGTRRAPAREADGHCIRCSEPVDANPDKPFCRSCFASWAEYENPDYEENFCHLCGREWSSSVAKPLCRSCWDPGRVSRCGRYSRPVSPHGVLTAAPGGAVPEERLRSCWRARSPQSVRLHSAARTRSNLAMACCRAP